MPKLEQQFSSILERDQSAHRHKFVDELMAQNETDFEDTLKDQTMESLLNLSHAAGMYLNRDFINDREKADDLMKIIGAINDVFVKGQISDLKTTKDQEALVDYVLEHFFMEQDHFQEARFKKEFVEQTPESLAQLQKIIVAYKENHEIESRTHTEIKLNNIQHVAEDMEKELKSTSSATMSR